VAAWRIYAICRVVAEIGAREYSVNGRLKEDGTDDALINAIEDEMENPTTVDVRAFINEQPFSGYQWLVFAMCFVIVLMDGFDTAAIGFIAPSLLGEWHLSKAALAPVLSAALFGLACGALLSGPVSDRWGRRMVLIGSVALFGVACLGSAHAASLTELTTLRFITGVGLGAAMPNAVTLMSEFCPDQRRSTIVNLMFCGFPLGAAFGGFLAAWMIPQFGWRSVLHFGGAVPLLLTVLLVLRLPESIRYMVARQQPVERIRKVLVHVSPAAHSARGFVMQESGNQAPGSSGIRIVLSRSFVLGSALLWLCYFMGLVIFYGLVNWMPVLLKEAGLSPQHASLVSALFPLGGAGTVLCGMLMDRFNPNRVVAAAYALGALSVFAIGQAIGNMGLLVCVVFLAGVLVNTAQASMPSLAAAWYPTAGRGTGVAWMLGVGRFGGIAGSFLVAELASQQVSLPGIFAVVAIAGGVSCAALLLKQAITSSAADEECASKKESLAH
jgi:MFS transporter, AAHS family, 4-hydroxybenzoate transporter